MYRKTVIDNIEYVRENKIADKEMLSLIADKIKVELSKAFSPKVVVNIPSTVIAEAIRFSARCLEGELTSHQEIYSFFLKRISLTLLRENPSLFKDLERETSAFRLEEKLSKDEIMQGLQENSALIFEVKQVLKGTFS